MFRLPLHVASLTAPSVPAECRRAFGADGTRFREADVALREAGMSAVLLGTCHRMELIWWGDHDGAGWLARWLAAHGAPASHALLQMHSAERAVRHLMSVAAGLESPRFAEVESQQQVKAAWRRAADAGATCTELDAVFAKVIEAARQIRSRVSALSLRPTLGQTAARAAMERAPMSWGEARIAVVGTGDAASSFCDALGHLPEPQEVMVVGHTAEHALDFALTHGALPFDWEALPMVLARADVVLFAVRTEEALRFEQAVLDAAAARPHGALWVDVGMPPTIDASTVPAAIRHIGLSELHAAERPDAALIAHAQEALQDELDRYALDLHRRRLGDGIQEAQSVALAIAHAELASAIGAAEAPRALTRDTVERLAERLANRVVYATIRSLVHGTEARAR